MKICFWGDIAGSLIGTTAGGGELQIALLAKALAKAGNEVIIIDININKDFISVDGIKVLSIKGWNKGILYFRTFTHRFPHLYRTLLNQNADVYYCRIRDFRHIFSYWAARKLKAKFILALASDLDASSLNMRIKHYYLSNHIGHPWWIFSGILTEIIYPFLIRKSDYIFVQHKDQQVILSNKKINSILFPNLIDLSVIHVATNSSREDFVYVGSIDKRKGIVEFFELVRKTPSCTFKIIGQPRGKAGYLYYEKLKSCTNVKLLGRLDHSETLLQIANSKALICTSPMEGFPNTFIEAWACSVPVLSLYVDPGNTIEKNGLGYIANGDMTKLVNYMLTNSFSIISTSYVLDNHAISNNKIIEIDTLFKKIIKYDGN